MITVEEAMLIVHIEVEPWWAANMPKDATLYVKPAMRADEHAIIMEYGAREWLVGNDARFMVVNAPLALVNRDNGEFRFVSANEAQARASRMQQVTATDKDIAQLKRDLQA